jgi:hypothetical protein
MGDENFIDRTWFNPGSTDCRGNCLASKFVYREISQAATESADRQAGAGEHYNVI